MACRPTRATNPTSRLLDPNNIGAPATSSHRQAVAHAIAKAAAQTLPPLPPTSTTFPPSSTEQSPPPSSIPSSRQPTPPNKRPQSEIFGDDEEEQSSDDNSSDGPAAKKPKRKKQKRARKTTDPNSVVDEHGMHQDVNVNDINNDNNTRKKANPTADVKHFFKPLPHEANSSKKRSVCKTCVAGAGCPKKNGVILADSSTQRRHMEFLHAGIYRKWAKENNFDSMLPRDSKARRAAQAEVHTQTFVDDHYTTQKPGDKPVPYSDELFKEAAIQWLVETDQPVQAFEHPTFQKMIQTAARATQGVHIPNRKQTREAIVTKFKEQMTALRSKIVNGEISITCDAWQASNANGYFAVTGHWIEEVSPNKWKLKHALLGFTQMNTAHDGIRLGQALYKICDRLNIVHKVGHITCDNASNNNTMMAEFAQRYKNKTGHFFDTKKRHIRCLAHIINLATQALIATRSKSKYYDPHSQDEHMPEVEGTNRDEVGLVRGICVKSRSSSQRKELFKMIQVRKDLKPLQLLLDMKVRWSSTYVMLHRAESQREAVNAFVYELGLKEDNVEKRRKIDALMLSDDEWDRVGMFCDLLGHADKAQHAFSAAIAPSLHNALPAIEALHSAWSKRAAKVKYTPFKEALEAATEKLEEYYQKTAESDAHILAMVLHPGRKMSHFEKYWDSGLADDVLGLLRDKFQDRYKILHPDTILPSASNISDLKKNPASGGLLRRRVIDTDSEDDDDIPTTPESWVVEFDRYIGTAEAVSIDVDIVDWWGLNASRYPTWALLARDYLAIMASSVSSERSFSAAGITISKRRNRLKEDIVEALQCLKCLYHEDLIFREVLTSAEVENDMDLTETILDTSYGNQGVVDDAEEFSWDQLIIDDTSDIEMVV